MFASEGDSVDVRRHEPVAWGERWNGRPPRADEADDAVAGVARRMQGRVDRHLWLLGRMQSDPLGPEPPGLPELLETAGRMRRDTEGMLLLCGQDPGVRADGPRHLADVLSDAAAAAEEPRRVDVRGAPAAALAPAAAIELLHVLAELVDHVTAVYPGARVEVTGRVEEPAGIVVEVRADGAARHDPEGLGGRRALDAADRLARRSRSGIALRTAGAGPAAVGPVASVHCPRAVVTLEEPEPTSSWSADRVRAEELPFGGSARVNGGPLPYPAAPAQVDELFGPLLDLAHDPMDGIAATPIFEAIASAWFREGNLDSAPHPGHSRNGNGGDPVDWETPADSEWRAAAARAEPADPGPLTSTGLPRRRPGNQLVPPPARVAPDPGPAERVPDRVRDRLSTYQRGLRQGRHRADDGPDPDPAEAW